MSETIRSMAARGAEDELFRRTAARLTQEVIPAALRKAAHTGIPDSYRFMADGRIALFARSGALVGHAADVAEAAVAIRRGDDQRLRLESDERRLRRGGGAIETSRLSSTTDDDAEISSTIEATLAPYRGEFAKLTPEQKAKLLAILTQEAKLLAATHERNRLATAVTNQAQREALKRQYASQAALVQQSTRRDP